MALEKTITITSSPYTDDYQDGNSPPWIYSETGFISWVDEVFFENYKKSEDHPFPSLDEAVEHLRAMGYIVEISE
jgi:hypothetical protein